MKKQFLSTTFTILYELTPPWVTPLKSVKNSLFFGILNVVIGLIFDELYFCILMANYCILLIFCVLQGVFGTSFCILMGLIYVFYARFFKCAPIGPLTPGLYRFNGWRSRNSTCIQRVIRNYRSFLRSSATMFRKPRDVQRQQTIQSGWFLTKADEQYYREALKEILGIHAEVLEEQWIYKKSHVRI